MNKSTSELIKKEAEKRMNDILDWIKKHDTYKVLPITNANSISYYVAPATYAKLIFDYTESPSAQQGWVRVEDGLPKDNNAVLCSNGYGYQIVLWYDHLSEAWVHINQQYFSSIPITHWQPLPAAPLT